MEAPAIKLYKLFRHDLHLTDSKSLELMNLLNNEYKSGLKADITALDKKMEARFEKVDARFEQLDKKVDALEKKVDARFEKVDERFVVIEGRLTAHDKRFDALDSKIDVTKAELHGAIHKSTTDISRWILGLAITLIGLFIAMWFKK